MSESNKIQIGGSHYRSKAQHWDFVEQNGICYVLGCATKYVCRARKKNGAEDWQKAAHYLRKAKELYEDGVIARRARLVNVERFGRANELTEQEQGIIYLAVNFRCGAQLEQAARMCEEASCNFHCS